MSARFGRNQKRKLREALSIQMMLTRQAATSLEHEKEARHRLKRECVEKIEAARMARDSIKIDIDTLLDPADERIRIRARFDNMGRRSDSLYSEVAINSRDMMIAKSDIEKESFIQLVGQQVAEHALHQIMRHWRSR